MNRANKVNAVELARGEAEEVAWFFWLSRPSLTSAKARRNRATSDCKSLTWGDAIRVNVLQMPSVGSFDPVRVGRHMDIGLLGFKRCIEADF